MIDPDDDVERLEPDGGNQDNQDTLEVVLRSKGLVWVWDWVDSSSMSSEVALLSGRTDEWHFKDLKRKLESLICYKGREMADGGPTTNELLNKFNNIPDQ